MAAAVAVALFASVGLGSVPAAAAPAGGDTPAKPMPVKSGEFGHRQLQ